MEVGSGITLNCFSTCLALATEIDFVNSNSAMCFLEGLVCANTKGKKQQVYQIRELKAH